MRSSGKDPKACKEKYCQYDEPHRDYIYTDEWVDFLVRKLSDKEEYKRVTSYSWQH